MIYFLQDYSESDALEIEIVELISELKQNNCGHNYQIVNSSHFVNYDDSVHSRNWIRQNAIPVGSIEFVQAFLREFHAISHMNPIEIPECLRLPHILLRDYKIVPYDQIPRDGEYFVKDVSRLKNWTYLGSMRGLFSPEFSQDDINPNHLFQVSDTLPILSEYRVIVIEDRIYGIQFYDGDPTIMPTPKEINKIKEMVTRYSIVKNRAMAYTMDVAVVRYDNKDGRDLALIEVHPFVAVGTYGCRGKFLPRAYKDGLRWYIEHNSPMEAYE